MATQAFTDAFVSINSVDLSDHVRSVTLNYAAEMLDETAMGATTRARKGGLKDWSVEIEFNQDYAASEVDATLFTLVGASSTIIVRPVNTGGVSATNPNYTGAAVLESYPPITGAVGDLHVTSVTFQGNGTLSRATE